MKYVKNMTVGSSLSDSKGELSTIGTFQIVEETVTELMGKLKIDGFTARDVYDAAWVFVRNRIKIYKHIPWSDNEVHSIGYISKKSTVTLCIDAEIRNSADELCVYARVELCALDLQSGRIRRVNTVGVDDSIVAETPIDDIVFARFEDKQLPEVDRVCIRYTNIDFVHHTNNKEYVRFILNTYTVNEMETRPIKEIEIKYINQSHEGDELSVCKEKSDNKDICAIVKDETPVVRCEIVF